MASLPLQPLHGAAQLLDVVGLGGQLLVETLQSGAQRLLGSALLASPRAGVRLEGRKVCQFKRCVSCSENAGGLEVCWSIV